MGRKQRDEVNLPGTAGITISTSNGIVTFDNGVGNTLGPKTAGGEAITTSTISRWLRVNVEGTTYFVPMWS